jgi:hypothetical protein
VGLAAEIAGAIDAYGFTTAAVYAGAGAIADALAPLVGSTVVAGSGTELAAADATETAAEDIPVLEIDASVMPNIARNIHAAVVEEGQPEVLFRETDAGVIAANRAAACSAFCGPGSPDEYPFASTMQGGVGARVASVPLAEQRIQGGVLSRFYQKYGIGRGDPFRVTINWGT